MLSEVIVIFLLNVFTPATGNDEIVLSDEDYGSIPSLFVFDNYDNCMLMKEKALYCSFTFTLEPLHSEQENHIWNILEVIKADPRNYRHDRLRHGICVPTKCHNITNIHREISVSEKVEICYNKKISAFGLSGRISNVLCQTSESKYSFDKYDIAIGLGLFVYFLLILCITIGDVIARRKRNTYPGNIYPTVGGSIMAAFSVPRNWRRLTIPNTSSEANKLLAIQGIRFYTMICVILCHTIMACFSGPIENTRYIETITNRALNMFIANGQYVVQTFFVISGWLLSYHFFQRFEEKGYMSMKDLILAFINRYIRLTPVLMVILALESTWLVHLGNGPQWNTLVVQEYENCRKNWWTNILYVNNYVNKKEMCLHQTWYLAADTQLYLFSLILFKFVSHIRRNIIIVVFCTTMAAGILLQGAIAFINNYDIVIRQYPESLYNMNVLKMDAWHDLFSSGHSNLTGYTIGLTAGYLFYKYQNIQLPIKKIYIFLWWILTFGLCIFIILIASIMYKPHYKYNRLDSALYWAFGKNLFALGIAIGIFGFTQNICGIPKWVFESNSIQIFGRLTYSTFIIHVPLIRVRAGLARYPVYVNDYVMVNTTVGDIMLSYIGGTLLCLTVEMPISALLKRLMPRGATKTIVGDNRNIRDKQVCTRL